MGNYNRLKFRNFNRNLNNYKKIIKIIVLC